LTEQGYYSILSIYSLIRFKKEIGNYKTMKKNRYSELSKDAVYLLSRSEFEKQKVITTEYAVKVLSNYLKATRLLDNLTKRNLNYSNNLFRIHQDVTFYQPSSRNLTD